MSSGVSTTAINIYQPSASAMYETLLTSVAWLWHESCILLGPDHQVGTTKTTNPTSGRGTATPATRLAQRTCMGAGRDYLTPFCPPKHLEPKYSQQIVGTIAQRWTSLGKVFYRNSGNDFETSERMYLKMPCLRQVRDSEDGNVCERFAGKSRQTGANFFLDFGYDLLVC